MYVEPWLLFSLFFLLFCLGFVLQIREFSSFGLRPESLLPGAWLPETEDLTLVQFHLKRTNATLMMHALLPAAYLLGFYYTHFLLPQRDSLSLSAGLAPFYELRWMQALLTLFLAGPLSVAALIYYWSLDHWSQHPFVKKIQPFARNGAAWTDVAKNVNAEFRSIDKFTIQSSPLTKVVVTNNWIVLFGAYPWHFHLAHHSDVDLQLVSSDQHHISAEGEAGGVQYLSIKVNSSRSSVQDFTFRLNALEYQNLQDKIRIENLDNILVLKTVGERFVDVFREEVENNPRAQEEQEDLEPCIGCMANTANVRLIRRCGTENSQVNPCTSCYCRPMWCLDCMAKWFASRQNQNAPESWLGSKCPCPTCRNKFCLLDVALLDGAL